MREIWIIVEREFRERVQTRSFVIGTLAFPVFMLAIFLLPALVDDSDEQRRIAVVDDAPPGVAETFIQALRTSNAPVEAAGSGDAAGTASATAGESPYEIEVVPSAASVEELRRRTLAEELDGYVILPADLLDTGEVLFRARNITNRRILRDVQLAATAAVQMQRLGGAGLDAADVRQLLAPVDVNTARITEGGEEGGDATSTFVVAYVLALLSYIIIGMYGNAVMRSVIQEKVTRISEILVSTVRAAHLMAGKIAGVSAAALLQVGIWAGMVALAVSQSAVLQERFGVPSSAIEAMRLEPGITAVLVAYFVLGFLLYAALFAALGAAVGSEQEAQPFHMVLMLPLFVPILFLAPITGDPEGGISTFLALFPLTAPVAMPMRLGAAPPEVGVVAASLGLLLLSTVVFAWVGGKIYRIGILATGKRPSLRELAHWIRVA